MQIDKIFTKTEHVLFSAAEYSCLWVTRVKSCGTTGSARLKQSTVVCVRHILRQVLISNGHRVSGV